MTWGVLYPCSDLIETMQNKLRNGCQLRPIFSLGYVSPIDVLLIRSKRISFILLVHDIVVTPNPRIAKPASYGLSLGCAFLYASYHGIRQFGFTEPIPL
jgi:hypothetical protein